MSSLTVDEKLLLIQKMRDHSDENKTKMQKRGHIYSRGSLDDEDLPLSESSSEHFRFLKLRIYVCMLLFGAFVLLDKSGISIQKHKVKEVIPYIQHMENFGKASDVMQAWSSQVVKTISKKSK